MMLSSLHLPCSLLRCVGLQHTPSLLVNRAQGIPSLLTVTKHLLTVATSAFSYMEE